MCEVNFHYNSAFTGTVYFCYPTGGIHKVNEYKKGVLSGGQLEYYKSGQLSEMSDSLKNCRWYENGILKEVTMYKNDGTIYKVTRFDERGNEIR